MNATTRKDSIASAVVLLAILVSALCGMFAIDVQATSASELRDAVSQPVCQSQAGGLIIGRIAL